MSYETITTKGGTVLINQEHIVSISILHTVDGKYVIYYRLTNQDSFKGEEFETKEDAEEELRKKLS